MALTDTERLLRETAHRLRLIAGGVWCRRVLLGSASLFLLGLLGARLLGVLPDRFTPVMLIAPPVLAFFAALLGARKPPILAAARRIDAQSGGKELFLTAVLASAQTGEFHPVVREQAERRAAELDAKKIVPLRWSRGALEMAAALAVLAAAMLWLPQLDPFRQVAAREKISQQEQQLRQMKMSTVQRAEILATQSAQQAAQVAQALAALEKTFQEARPQEREANLQRLAEDQKELGELWRKVSRDGLRQALEKGAQSFGQMDAQQLAAWREQLKKGDVSGIKQELAELRRALEQLAAQADSAEKRAGQEALAQRLNQLAEALKQTAGSPQLDAALARAQQQLDFSKLNALSPEAMQGALDSLQLSEQELQQLAQSLQDGQALEEALKNLQMAKQLAAQGKLDGGENAAAGGMADYAALFAAKMTELGELAGTGGSGMGQGIGNGAKRPEDESVSTGFKSEKSTSALAGGKMLLEWKTKEVGESGARAEDFRAAVREVKQGVSEALQAEQVPPGYHDAIKKYFDTLPAR